MFWTCATILFVCYLCMRWIRSLKVGDYVNKHVFITGCDTGFGKDLTIRLDTLGFQVISGCLTEQGKSNLLQCCSTRVKSCLLDISRDESIREAHTFVQDVLPRGKGLWAIVNNAGVPGSQAVAEMLNREDYVNTLQVNLIGPTQVVNTFLPLIRKEKGRIVNMTSVMGRFAGITAPYCMSKFGLEGYLDVLRRELYTQGIKVSILEPGLFSTAILNSDVHKKATRKAFDGASDEVKSVYGHDFCEKNHKTVQRISARAPTDTSWVVDSYVHAITARFPHTRYVVGWDALCFFVPLSYMPDWLSDWVLYRFRQRLDKKLN